MSEHLLHAKTVLKNTVKSTSESIVNAAAIGNYTCQKLGALGEAFGNLVEVEKDATPSETKHCQSFEQFQSLHKELKDIVTKVKRKLSAGEADFETIKLIERGLRLNERANKFIERSARFLIGACDVYSQQPDQSFQQYRAYLLKEKKPLQAQFHDDRISNVDGKRNKISFAYSNFSKLAKKLMKHGIKAHQIQQQVLADQTNLIVSLRQQMESLRQRLESSASTGGPVDTEIDGEDTFASFCGTMCYIFCVLVVLGFVFWIWAAVTLVNESIRGVVDAVGAGHSLVWYLLVAILLTIVIIGCSGGCFVLFEKSVCRLKKCVCGVRGCCSQACNRCKTNCCDGSFFRTFNCCAQGFNKSNTE